MTLFQKTNRLALMLVIMVALVATVAWAGDDANDDTGEEPPVVTVIDSAATIVDTTTAEVTDKVIAYYLHGDRRCATCIKLEKYSQEAIETGFVDELKQGGLEWRVVNFEDEGNEHFVDSYELYTKAVILSRISGGKETGWKNLDKIWDLVGDQAKFIEYVQSETKAFMIEDNQ
jgi:hypothetical protein